MLLKNKWTVGIGAVIILASCSVPKAVVKKELAPIPTKYKEEVIEEKSIASLHYKDFFQDPHLVQVVDKVLANNFDNQIALQQIEIAKATLQARRGALLPAVQAGIIGSGTHYGKHTIEGVGNFDTNLSPNIDKSQRVNTNFTPNYWLGLSASWELDIWGKLSNWKRAAQARYLATVQGKNLIQSSLVSQAANLYYELIAIDRQKAILREHITLQQDALDIVNIQKEVGRATELAVQQFVAQLANTEANLIALQQESVKIENELLALMGDYEGKVVRASDFGNMAWNYDLKEGHPSQLLHNRPDISAAYNELAATHADAKAARAAFFPTIGLSAYGAYSAFNSSYLFNPTSLVYQLLGNITAPIFQQNQLKSQFKIASAQQEIAFLDYQKKVLNAFQEVRTVLSYLGHNERLLAQKQKEVQAQENSVEISNDLYVTGYASYLEIINAQKSKIAADMELSIAQKNQAQAMLQLYKVLGGGWQ
jgi:multidrug efflux system outer membrane protein